MNIFHPRFRLFSSLLVLLTVGSATAQDHQVLRSYMEELVESGAAVGCMAQVTQDGETVFREAFGLVSPDGEELLGPDTIVRIYSMTKPITSVAAMILAQDGKLGLDDPVSMYIPEFADITVGTWSEGEPRRASTMQRRPPRRSVTVRDLLLHTSGLGYGFTLPREWHPAYENIWTDSPDLADAIRNVAAVPLVQDPGEGWLYGINSDVLGRVVEVASGQPFEVFLEERIFKPLGMNETAFKPVDPDRVMPTVSFSLETGSWQIDLTHPTQDDVKPDHYLPLGGEGLYSTLNDYTQFCLMMLNRGTLNGARILEPQTVDFMTRNHLGPDLDPGLFAFGMGFALQAPVSTPQGPRGGGRWTWGGAACTYFFIDPEQELVAVFATQQFPFSMLMADGFHSTVLRSVAADEARANARVDEPARVQ